MEKSGTRKLVVGKVYIKISYLFLLWKKKLQLATIRVGIKKGNIILSKLSKSPLSTCL